MGKPYQSPSAFRILAWFEDRMLAPDSSFWTGRRPMYARMVAEVSRALYLNFLVKKSLATTLAAGLFVPHDLPDKNDAVLFTILLFTLERARPRWAPGILGALAPRIMQSNWRLYGDIAEPTVESRCGVLFVRTVTTSLLLAAFGRRFARCFPLRRARRMQLDCNSPQVTAFIDAGSGTAPELVFEGQKTEFAMPPRVNGEWADYNSYARSVIDQHLSLAVWPQEYVV